MVGPQVGKPAIPQILNRRQLTSSPSHLEDFRTHDPGLDLSSPSVTAIIRGALMALSRGGARTDSARQTWGT
jgi:hypothetical protein